MTRRRQRARTFARFCAEMRRLLDQDAAGKGYHAVSPDGPNRLYEFVAETVGGLGSPNECGWPEWGEREPAR